MFYWNRLALMLVLCSFGTADRAGAGDLPSRFDFCGEGEPKRWVHVIVDESAKSPWNVILTANGRNEPAKTSTYIFGSVEPRAGFLVAILPMEKTPPLLIFDDGHAEWAGHYYVKCP